MGCIIVLVLDWWRRAIQRRAYFRRIFLVLAHVIRVDTLLHPPLFLGARQSHRQPRPLVETPISQQKGGWCRWPRSSATESPFHDSVCDRAIWKFAPNLTIVVVHSYPAIYCVVIIPLSVVRWISGFGGNRHVPSAATFFAIFLYNLSGAFNALLFLLTRSELFLLGNNSSYLGRAPGTLLTDGKNQTSGLNDTNSTRSRSMLHQQPEIVVTTEEEGWHLPNLEQQSEE